MGPVFGVSFGNGVKHGRKKWNVFGDARLFNFCLNLIKFYQIFPNFTQIIQICPNLTRICPNFTQMCIILPKFA